MKLLNIIIMKMYQISVNLITFECIGYFVLGDNQIRTKLDLIFVKESIKIKSERNEVTVERIGSSNIIFYIFK